MADLKKHIVHINEPISTTLKMLNELGEDLTIFAVDDNDKMIGTLTDGDIRRGLLKGLSIHDKVSQVINPDFHYIQKENYHVKEIIEAKNLGIQILPVLDEEKRIIKLINFAIHKSFLPIDAVIMAGGEGIRLRPLTEKTPKPLLIIGNKPIMEHGIDRMVEFGIDQIQISVNYLGEKIKNYFGNGTNKNISISYIEEKEKMGTIGSLSLANEFLNDTVLVMNSDLLTNIDLEEFYLEFESKNADMAVACIPFTVNIPYAILDTMNENVIALKEKPNLTYQSNGGIYLIKKEILKMIPKNQHFNATDLIETLIAANKKVIYYSILGYWLDIGKMDDFRKAQTDIKHIKI